MTSSIIIPAICAALAILSVLALMIQLLHQRREARTGPTDSAAMKDLRQRLLHSRTQLQRLQPTTSTPPPGQGLPTAHLGDELRMLDDASRFENEGRLSDAIRLYERILSSYTSDTGANLHPPTDSIAIPEAATSRLVDLSARVEPTREMTRLLAGAADVIERVRSNLKPADERPGLLTS